MVVAMTLVMGCGNGPRTITASDPDHGRTLSVTVADETGLVHDVAFLKSPLEGDAAWGRVQVGSVPGRPEAAQLAWMDGPCPSPVDLRVSGRLGALRVDLRRGSTPDDPDCGWPVALVRRATILFKVPIDAASIEGVDGDHG
jgi:hypothetical protein